MKLKLKVMREETLELDVPDHFSSDTTITGEVVDILVGGFRRNDLWDSDESVVKHACYDLEQAYATATKIVELFEANGEVEQLRAAMRKAENSLDHGDVGSAIAFIHLGLKPHKTVPPLGEKP